MAQQPHRARRSTPAPDTRHRHPLAPGILATLRGSALAGRLSVLAGCLAIVSIAPDLALPLRAEPSQQAEQAIRATYLCRGRFDALALTALFFNRSPAEVVLLEGEKATRLPQLIAASGARYGSGSQEFWIKGDQASWRLGPHPAATMACTAQPAQSQR